MRTRIDEWELTEAAGLGVAVVQCCAPVRLHDCRELVIAVRTIEEQYDDRPQILCDLILSTFGNSNIHRSPQIV